MTQKCPSCLKMFSQKDPKRPSTYCSRICAGRARRTSVEVECVICRKTFQRRPYHAKKSLERGPFCGFRCYAEWQRKNMVGKSNPSWKARVPLECHSCGSTFLVLPSQTHKLFCSKKCFLDRHRKEYPSTAACYNHQWVKARMAALLRDCHKCVHCSGTDRLLVHHKKPLRDFLAEAVRLAHALDNLETTCEGCHGHQHSLLLKNRASIH